MPLDTTIRVRELNDDVVPTKRGKPLTKKLLMWVRRGHMYFGLFLFPWAILYGITAFLFNHPTVWSDQPTFSYSSDATVGTALEKPVSPQDIAQQVVAKINENQQPATPYRLVGEAKFRGRAFAFATVKTETTTINVLYDAKNGGGTVRMTTTPNQVEPDPAPFATDNATPAAPNNTTGPGSLTSNSGILLKNPLTKKFESAVPAILKHVNLPTTGTVTVTSVPEVEFSIDDGSRTWQATYNISTGAVRGVATDQAPKTEISWRRFVLRLHTTHGYPGEVNQNWFWALLVDAMAFTMCFWGFSGLLMWWQIKSTRKLGAMILLFSTLIASSLGYLMHVALTST
ncbi:MAG: hypothetical protein R3B84_21575 [Zavarzinella sp.]